MIARFSALKNRTIGNAYSTALPSPHLTKMGSGPKIQRIGLTSTIAHITNWFARRYPATSRVRAVFDFSKLRTSRTLPAHLQRTFDVYLELIEQALYLSHLGLHVR